MKAIIKENEAYRLVLTKTACLRPEQLFSIELTGEQLKDGEVAESSTYQFFMTQDEIQILSKALIE